MCRENVENVLSGTKAGFKTTRNLVFNQKAERKKMENQKSKSTFSAILMSLTLGVTVFLAGPAAAQKYVTDPSTGKVVTAPEYGGTITFVRKAGEMGSDVLITGGWGQMYIAGVLEKLAMADWTTPRDKYDFQFLNVPTNTVGALAESWSQPDPLTYIVKVRQGVHWHDKAPMSGRELTAQDIEYNFHRITGTGSGFTELAPAIKWGLFTALHFDSITATDQIDGCFQAEGAKPRCAGCYPRRMDFLDIPPRGN